MADRITPGKWTVERYGDGNALVIHSDADNRVCFMATAGSHGDPALIKADANLIALAGTTANRLSALGYDAERVLERLPEVLDLLAKFCKATGPSPLSGIKYGRNLSSLRAVGRVLLTTLTRGEG